MSTDREFFEENFRTINERLDGNDKILNALASVSVTQVDTQAKMVHLIDDALQLSKKSLDVRRDLDEALFKIGLIELRLEMKSGELPI